MPKCKSWRFVDAGVPQEEHLPVGKNHACWKPCRNQVAAGVNRCADCTKALMFCTNNSVRKAFALEPNQTRDVLEALLTDGIPTIASIAEQRLEELGFREPAVIPTRNIRYSSAEVPADVPAPTPELRPKPKQKTKPAPAPRKPRIDRTAKTKPATPATNVDDNDDIFDRKPKKRSNRR